MNITASARHTIRQSVGVVLITMGFGQLFTAGAQDRNHEPGRLDTARQVCLSGKSNQNLDSCIKEAEAVLGEQAGSRPSVSAEQLQRNAELRCDALTGNERAACIARIRGEGSVSGSVAAGGILREHVTTEVLPPDSKRQESAPASEK